MKCNVMGHTWVTEDELIYIFSFSAEYQISHCLFTNSHLHIVNDISSSANASIFTKISFGNINNS